MSIPHTIHQIWLGPNQRPTDLMDGWDYRLWDETAVGQFGLSNESLYRWFIDQRIYYGAADVVRVEVLHDQGGIYVDADTAGTTRRPGPWTYPAPGPFAAWSGRWSLLRASAGLCRRSPTRRPGAAHPDACTTRGKAGATGAWRTSDRREPTRCNGRPGPSRRTTGTPTCPAWRSHRRALLRCAGWGRRKLLTCRVDQMATASSVNATATRSRTEASVASS